MSKPAPEDVYPDTYVRAKDLCVKHIGTVFRFLTYNMVNDIVVMTTGELRQVYHHGGETVLTIGQGAEVEVVLQHDQLLSMGAYDDYSDAKTLVAEWRESLR